MGPKNENEQWDLDNVNQKLRTKMERAADTVIKKRAEMAGKTRSAPVDLRTAALLVAIERVAHVAVERGIWP